MRPEDTSRSARHAPPPTTAWDATPGVIETVEVHWNKFAKMPKTVLADPSLTPAEKVVFAAIVSRDWDNDKKCRPSMHTLAADSGVSRTTVKKAIKTLTERMLVSVASGDSRRSNVYTINDQYLVRRSDSALQGVSECPTERQILPYRGSECAHGVDNQVLEESGEDGDETRSRAGLGSRGTAKDTAQRMTKRTSTGGGGGAAPGTGGYGTEPQSEGARVGPEPGSPIPPVKVCRSAQALAAYFTEAATVWMKEHGFPLAEFQNNEKALAKNMRGWMDKASISPGEPISPVLIQVGIDDWFARLDRHKVARSAYPLWKTFLAERTKVITDALETCRSSKGYLSSGAWKGPPHRATHELLGPKVSDEERERLYAEAWDAYEAVQSSPRSNPAFWAEWVLEDRWKDKHSPDALRQRSLWDSDETSRAASLAAKDLFDAQLDAEDAQRERRARQAAQRRGA